MGGSLLQTPVVWLLKKGENNKIEKGEDEREKRAKETHCREQNNRLVGKVWKRCLKMERGWRGLKKQKGKEWKPHEIQEDIENLFY